MVIHHFQYSVENIANIILTTVIFPQTEYRYTVVWAFFFSGKMEEKMVL